MPKLSLFLLVSFSLTTLSSSAGNFFGSMDKHALKDMIMNNINDPSFKAAPVRLNVGSMDWGIFATVRSLLGEGIHPSIQVLQELDVPKQTTLQNVQDAAAYAKATGTIASAVGSVAKAAADTTSSTVDVQKSINDSEEQRQRTAQLQQSAEASPSQSVQGRPRSLSSERREAVAQVNNMSLEESRYMARQEELTNSPSRYFRELHFKRVNDLIKVNTQETTKR